MENQDTGQWFGLLPPQDREVTCAWGARAILEMQRVPKQRKVRGKITRWTEREPSVELLWDRQSTVGDPSHLKKLTTFLNTKGLKALSKEVKRIHLCPDSEDYITLDIDGYRIQASPRASFGYLYIVAYPHAEKTNET